MIFMIELINTLQLIYEPQFGKPWHNVMFNALHDVN